MNDIYVYYVSINTGQYNNSKGCSQEKWYKVISERKLLGKKGSGGGKINNYAELQRMKKQPKKPQRKVSALKRHKLYQ